MHLELTDDANFMKVSLFTSHAGIWKRCQTAGSLCHSLYGRPHS